MHVYVVSSATSPWDHTFLFLTSFSPISPLCLTRNLFFYFHDICTYMCLSKYHAISRIHKCEETTHSSSGDTLNLFNAIILNPIHCPANNTICSFKLFHSIYCCFSLVCFWVGHVGLLYNLDVVNSVSLNSEVQVPLW